MEAETYVCNHCNFVVVMNAQRTRPREVCLRCMAIVCDPCAALGACTPFIAQYMDAPGVIVSVPGAPARTTPFPLGLLVPDHNSL